MGVLLSAGGSPSVSCQRSRIPELPPRKLKTELQAGHVPHFDSQVFLIVYSSNIF